jgi:hypothetical protein
VLVDDLESAWAGRSVDVFERVNTLSRKSTVPSTANAGSLRAPFLISDTASSTR